MLQRRRKLNADCQQQFESRAHLDGGRRPDLPTVEAVDRGKRRFESTRRRVSLSKRSLSSGASDPTKKKQHDEL